VAFGEQLTDARRKHPEVPPYVTNSTGGKSMSRPRNLAKTHPFLLPRGQSMHYPVGSYRVPDASTSPQSRGISDLPLSFWKG